MNQKGDDDRPPAHAEGPGENRDQQATATDRRTAVDSALKSSSAWVGNNLERPPEPSDGHVRPGPICNLAGGLCVKGRGQTPAEGFAVLYDQKGRRLDVLFVRGMPEPGTVLCGRRGLACVVQNCVRISQAPIFYTTVCLLPVLPVNFGGTGS